MRDLLLLARIVFVVCFTQTGQLYAENEIDEDLSVGVITALTGPLAEYGAAMQNGIELAVSEQPERFQGIKFIYEDVGYEAGRAVLAFRKLRSVDKVNLIYSFGVHLSRSLAPLAKSYKLPLVAQSIDPLITRNNDYVVRFFNESDQYARALTSYVRQKGYKKIGVVLAHDSYLEDVLVHIKRVLKPDESIVIIDQYQLGQVDFRSTVSKVKGGDFDVIGVLLGSGQIGPFYRQYAQQRVVTPTFGSNLFESTSEFEASRGAMQGAVFANNVVRPWFRLRYRKRFGDESQITFAAMAFEFALVVAEVRAASTRDDTAEQLIAVLERVPQKLDAATGRLRFRNKPGVGRFFESTLVVKQLEPDGRQKVALTYLP